MYKRTSDYTFVATLLFQLVQKMRFTWSTTLAGRLCLNLFPGCACDSSGYLFCISTSRVLERGRGEEEKNSCHPGQRGHSSFIGDNVGSIFFHNRQRAFSSAVGPRGSLLRRQAASRELACALPAASILFSSAVVSQRESSAPPGRIKGARLYFACAIYLAIAILLF